MAYLARAKKENIRLTIDEMGGEASERKKVIELRNIILGLENYEKELAKGVLEGIIEDRKEKHRVEAESQAEKQRVEAETQRLELLHRQAVEMEKLRLEIPRAVDSVRRNLETASKTRSRELLLLMPPKFNSNHVEINLYLTMFERQAKKLEIAKTEWVAQLLALLPLEVGQLILREPENTAEDYDYIKELLLWRFKLN